MSLPNFFIIGAPKSGTTALSEYLRGHPSVYFSEPKELHYFNSDFANRYVSSWEEYIAHFGEVDSKHRAVGEGSVFYLASAVAVPNILARVPDAKFIVMLRNPIEAAYAWHRQALYSFGEDQLDFGRAWNLQTERRAGHSVPPHCREVRTLLYGELFQYGEQLSRLLTLVTRKQIHVILFEDFVSDAKKAYEQALAFLDLETDGRTSFPPVNESKVYRSFWVEQLVRTGRKAWYTVKLRAGIRMDLQLAARIRGANTRVVPRQQLSENLRAELSSYFAEDVRLLGQLLDLDLEHWLDP